MTLYTLGYGGLVPYRDAYTKLIPRIVEIVQEHDALLVDIRDRPGGLVPREKAQAALGKRYTWVKELGHPQWQQNAPCTTLRALGHEPLILMCAEKDVNRCHRLETARIVSKNRGGEEVVHLHSPPEQPKPPEPVRPRTLLDYAVIVLLRGVR